MLGLIWGLCVHAASVQDRDGGGIVLAMLHWLPRLKLIWADSGYKGGLVTIVAALLGLTLEIVRRTAKKGWELLKHRWIVERTFGWLNRYRRLSKDYECNPSSSENWIWIAMTHVMVRRLAPNVI